MNMSVPTDFHQTALLLAFQEAAAAPATRSIGVPTAAAAPGQAATTTQPAAVVPATGAGGVSPAGPASPFGGSGFLLLMVGMMAILIVPSILAGRREKKKREELMSSMKKGDKVQTSSGMIGTVVEMGQDDLVLKFEEGRIRFVKAAVVAILKSSATPKSDNAVAEIKGESRPVNV